jgi:hypothetical protein
MFLEICKILATTMQEHVLNLNLELEEAPAKFSGFCGNKQVVYPSQPVRGGDSLSRKTRSEQPIYAANKCKLGAKAIFATGC